MKAYIHGFGNSSVEVDFKQIVSDALMRRRMSRIVRNGVTAAWVAQGERKVDAILTATSLGCMTDSEKFLRNVIDTDEQLLSPTSFIQSTFNTIGATVALLQGNHCYNMTYAHGRDSLMSALLDGAMQLEEMPGKMILAGTVEEFTPTVNELLQRMRYDNSSAEGGAVFFLLSAEKERALAEIELSTRHSEEEPMRRYSNPLELAWRMDEALREKRNLRYEGSYLTLKCL